MPEYLYHISERDLGQNPVLIPRRHGKNRASNEPPTARVCTAPSLAHCLVALSHLGYKKIHVYRTLKTQNCIRVRKGHGIFDSCITKEHWVLKKARYRRVMTLDPMVDAKLFDSIFDFNMKTIGMLGDGSKHSMKAQREFIKVFRSFLKKHYPELA